MNNSEKNRKSICIFLRLAGFSVLPSALGPKMESLCWKVRYRGKDIEIRWDRPDGNDRFGDSNEGYTVLVDNRVVFHSDQLPEKRHRIALSNP